jgi:hypothetical protein
MRNALARKPMRPLILATLIAHRCFFAMNANPGHMRRSSPPLLALETRGSVASIDWPCVRIWLGYDVNGRLIRHFVRPRLDRLLDRRLFIWL